MAKEFKQLAAATRAAIPQFDPEASPQRPTAPAKEPSIPAPEASTAAPPPTITTLEGEVIPPQLTRVDTSEMPANRGFHMYPSRHRQVTHDLAYIEDRKPWQIIEDALEEYVVHRYGKGNKRK